MKNKKLSLCGLAALLGTLCCVMPTATADEKPAPAPKEGEAPKPAAPAEPAAPETKDPAAPEAPKPDK